MYEYFCSSKFSAPEASVLQGPQFCQDSVKEGSAAFAQLDRRTSTATEKKNPNQTTLLPFVSLYRGAASLPLRNRSGDETPERENRRGSAAERSRLPGDKGNRSGARTALAGRSDPGRPWAQRRAQGRAAAHLAPGSGNDEAQRRVSRTCGSAARPGRRGASSSPGRAEAGGGAARRPPLRSRRAG